MRIPAWSLAVCLAVLPLAAQADPFSEFRIPDHSWRSGSLGASAAGAWLTQGIANSEQRQSVFQSILQPRVLFARDSDPLFWLLSATAAGQAGVRDSRASTAFSTSTQSNDGHEQFSIAAWQVNGALRAYPWELPLGVGMSAVVTGENRQDWTRTFSRAVLAGSPVQRVEQSVRMDLHAYRYGATVDLSAGLGRVRDATVAQDVRVLEERLQVSGALARPLSAGAREKLAALYYVSPDYSSAHDRPSRYFWRDLERILREDGALSEQGFDPYSVMRSAEGYSYRVARSRGWFVGPVLSGRHRHDATRYDERASSHYYLDDVLQFGGDSWSASRFVNSLDEVDLGGAAEYHRPLDWRWQLDLSSRVTAPARPGDHGLHASSSGALIWLVADRWLASASLSQARDYFKRRGFPLQEDAWVVDAGVQLGWYVEDHTQLSAGISQRQQRRTAFGSFEPLFREFDRITSVSIGLSYRFLGGLDAPGLIEPVRPVR